MDRTKQRFVARSRHKTLLNGTARHLIGNFNPVCARLGSIFEGVLTRELRSSAVREGLEPRWLGGHGEQCGGVAPLASGRFTRDGHTGGLDPSAGRVATSKRACREATGARMVAPVGVGEWNA